MKNALTILLCLVVLLMAGCGAREPEETTVPTQTTTVPTEPTETEPPVPETLSAEVLAARTGVILTTLDRGETVDIVDTYDENHYVVKLDAGYGLIEKYLVRMADEENVEPWTGYARYGTMFYTDYHFSAESGRKLATNTKVQVLDTLQDGERCVVQLEEEIGYAEAAKISQHRIQSKSGGSGDGGGGGGGGGSSYGADGGDIALFAHGGVTLLSTFVPQTGETAGTAVVLVNGAEVLLGWYDRGETAQVVNEPGFAEEKEGFCPVYLDGLYGYIRQNLLLQEGTEPYAEWDGFARYGSQLYDNYYLSGEPLRKLSTNTKVHVICDLGSCCLVSLNDGEEIGYMDLEKVSQKRIVSKPSGGGDSGGGGGGGGQEWSDPVL